MAKTIPPDLKHSRSKMNAQPDRPALEALVFDAQQHPGMIQPDGDFWLFAYGSLMWRPDFPFLRNEPARLYGYQRRLCLWSVAYRGSLAHPGLVMGLDTGGSCVGRAFLISAKVAPEVFDQLNQREMITGAYESLLKPLHLPCGNIVNGVCFMARKNHPQYVTNLSITSTVDIVRHANGHFGSNRDYVLNTVTSLREMGLKSTSLERIAHHLENAD